MPNVVGTVWQVRTACFQCHCSFVVASEHPLVISEQIGSDSRACLPRYWRNKHLSPKRLSTGILMYTLASAICDEIHLYGFWPFGFDPNTREDLPYHYYDKKGTKFTTKWQESHQLPAEFQLLYRMHGEGLAKLTLSHCA